MSARLFPWLAIGVAALALVLAALAAREASSGAPVTAPTAPEAAPALPASPPDATLTRCQALGEAGARDAGCLAAWAANRRRFLGLEPVPAKE